jgi:hypothetical protein
MFTSEAWNNPLEGAYEIEYALSLDSGDSDYLTWTPGSAGNQQKWTISLWFKGKTTNTEEPIYGGGSSGSQYYLIGFKNTNKMEMDFQTGGPAFRSTATTFRSTSAWKHLVIALDSTQGTAGNRMKWYINGTQVTAWDTETQPSENGDVNWINTTSAQSISNLTWAAGANYYLADINFVDGAQLAPTVFGETSGSDWIPIDPEPTYGTNGYRLEFKQTGTSQNASGIGADTSGNANHFAVANLTSSNRITDTPTNPS